MRARLAVAGAVLGAVLCSGTAAMAATPGAAGGAGVPRAAGAFAGFGATLAAFAARHPADAGKCPDTSCYGPLVASLRPTYEFGELAFLKGRVVGYDQALPRGTPLLQAELEVAQLFPGDAQASEVTVVRRDQYGASCAVYDIHSDELAHLFGRAAFGDDGGNVGVELATLQPDGLTTWNPRAIDLAIVMPQYADRSTNC